MQSTLSQKLPPAIASQKEDLLKIKKLLSFILRHKPFLYKIKLDGEGYADVKKLLEVIKTAQKIEVTLEEFIYVIKDLSGGIFKLNSDKTKVCARHGHTFIYNMNVPDGFVETVNIPNELYFNMCNNDFVPLLKTQFIPCSNRGIRLFVNSPAKEKNIATCRVFTRKMDVKKNKFYYSEKEKAYFTKVIPTNSIVLNV